MVDLMELNIVMHFIFKMPLEFERILNLCLSQMLQNYNSYHLSLLGMLAGSDGSWEFNIWRTTGSPPQVKI